MLDDVSVAERDELLGLVAHRRMRSVEQNKWLLAHTAHGPKAAEMEKLEGYDELVKQALAQMPPRLRLEGMTPEQVREGLPPEELLLALSDDVLRQLPDSLIDKQPQAVRDEIRRRIQTH